MNHIPEDNSYFYVLANQSPATMFNRYFTNKNLQIDWKEDFKNKYSEFDPEDLNKPLYPYTRKIPKLMLNWILNKISNSVNMPKGYKLYAGLIITDLEMLLAEHASSINDIRNNQNQLPLFLRNVTEELAFAISMAKPEIKKLTKQTNPSNAKLTI